MENRNYVVLYKPKFKKCGVKYDLGFGILTMNPTLYEKSKQTHYRKIIWLWFENYWYSIKSNKFKTLEEVNNYISENTYTKEQVIEKILNLV